jgi:hypothetical protein
MQKILNSNGQKVDSLHLFLMEYKINTFLFDVSSVAQVHIQDNMVNYNTPDGEPLDTGQIAGKSLQGDKTHNFQDFDKF